MFWLAVQAGSRAVLPVRILRRWRPGRSWDGGPVVVVGLFRDTRGVAQAARLFADALEQSGFKVTRIDAGEALGIASVLALPSGWADNSRDAPPGGVAVTCLNPPELLLWLVRGGGRYLQGRRHVGYWAWELPAAPAAWRSALHFVDEVWCHSDFTSAAIRDLANGRRPVRTLPLPIFAGGRAARDRARFDLPERACVVLTAMDLRSSAARKNPLGALEAYLRASPAEDGGSLLVCKLSGIEARTDIAVALEDACARRSDIRLLTGLLSSADMGALVASADIVLTLHRAEGFGLLAAEAAWEGRPVVTTGWSAPAEFLHPEGAALVGWTLSPVEDPQGQYDTVGSKWAEPDLDQAAGQLRTLIGSVETRNRMGARARRHAEDVFDAERWAHRMRDFLLNPASTARRA